MTTTPDTAADSGVYTPGYIGRIPVRNIWLLMLYASRLYRELPDSRRVAVEDAPDDIPNLVAEILTRAVARRLGPDKGNSRYLYRLFPDGPARQACRYAGLPKPSGCI